MTDCDWIVPNLDSAGGLLDWQQAAMASSVLKIAPTVHGLHPSLSDPLTHQVAQLASMGCRSIDGG